MKKLLGAAVWILAITACSDEATQPTALEAPGAAVTAEAASTDDGDFGADLVAAEWEAFNADPANKPGTNVVEPALAELLGTLDAATKVEVIVSFDRTKTSGDAVASRLHALGAGTIGFRHLPMVFAIGTPAAVREIAAMPGVESVYRNKQLEYHLAEATKAIRADATWTELGFLGTGVGVAILDSGIDGLYHPGLAYPTKTIRNVKYVANVADLVTFSDDAPAKPAAELFIDNVANSETSVGHGTHVAGIAAGDGSGSSANIYRGVAPGANLVGIGAGDILFIFWILAGFDYTLEHAAAANIKVVNNSWGSEGAFDPNDPINKATYEVYKAGITVVFSAGNSGPGENTLNPYSVAPWTISVAAGCKMGVEDPTNSASRCNDGRGRIVADFSSRGIPGDRVYHPDIIAPGVRIVSARASTGTVLNGLDLNSDLRFCNISVQHEPYWTCASGTSMSAPMVAGTVALMQQAAKNTLTPDQVLGALKKSSVKLQGYAEWEVGSGFLDAYSATRRVRR